MTFWEGSWSPIWLEVGPKLAPKWPKLGFFFGFLRAYVISVCIFATIDIIYNHNKWPINLDQSISFPYVLKGSNYLIKEFPNEENYQDTKEKVQEL